MVSTSAACASVSGWEMSRTWTIEVGVEHLLQRRAEGGDELRRQVGDEAHGVRQDDASAVGKLHLPHGRIEGGEEHVLGHHVGPGEPVEERGLARVGVADEGDDGIGHLGAGGAVQFAGADDLGELLLELDHLLVDGAAVGLLLGLAGAADEAEAAALPLEMGPGAHEAGALVGEGREVDLQHALAGGGAVGEDLEDETGAVQQLDLPGLLEVALLHRGDRAVDQDELDLLGLDAGAQLLDLALAEEHAGIGLGQAHDLRPHDLQPGQRVGQRDGLLERAPGRARSGRRRGCRDAGPARGSGAPGSRGRAARGADQAGSAESSSPE